MRPSLSKRIFFKSRALINASNALVLARLNGSTVVSGFPKTGTTYLSHVAQYATGRTYIEGSRGLALWPSVVHCHFRAVPRTAVFSYRPVEKVMASYTTHLLGYAADGIFERLTSGTETEADLARTRETALGILRGGRMPSPKGYYADVVARGGFIVPVEALKDPESSLHGRLARWWKLPDADLVRGIAEAERLSQARRKQGNEFYNRPSARIGEILDSDQALSGKISQEGAAVRALLGDRLGGTGHYD